MDSKISGKVYENEIPHQEKSISYWQRRFAELYMEMYHDLLCRDMFVIIRPNMNNGYADVEFTIR